MVGAVLGIGSTMVVDRTRYRREQASRVQASRVQDSLRDLHSGYLAALNASSSSLRVIMLRESDAAARYQAALDASRDAAVLTQRYGVVLQAPPTVHEKSDWAYRRCGSGVTCLARIGTSPPHRRSISMGWNVSTKPERTSKPRCVQGSLPQAGHVAPRRRA